MRSQTKSVDPVLLLVAHVHHEDDAAIVLFLHLLHLPHHVLPKYDLPLQCVVLVVFVLAVYLIHVGIAHCVERERSLAVDQDVLDCVGVLFGGYLPRRPLMGRRLV
jgi:hypothetical protein